MAPSDRETAPDVSGGETSVGFSDGESAVDFLSIGDSLFVEATELLPASNVEILLVDDFSRVVAQRSAWTDSNGDLASVELWVASGIIGCDSGRKVDPGASEFMDYDQAEAYLDQRTFRVEIQDATGDLLDERDLPLNVTSKPRYFYSDVYGCPRTTFDFDEDVFLTTRHVNLKNTDLAVFFVHQQAPVSSDGMIQEVRQPFTIIPQVVSQGSGSAWTLLLWSSADSFPGDFETYLDFFKGDPSFLWTPNHFAAETVRGQDGITINTWSCDDCD